MKTKQNKDHSLCCKVTKGVLDEFDRIAAEDRRGRADALRVLVLEHIEINRHLRERSGRNA